MRPVSSILCHWLTRVGFRPWAYPVHIYFSPEGATCCMRKSEGHMKEHVQLLASCWPFEAINFPHLPSADTHASAALTGTTSVAVSHLLPCWYHSGSSLAKINQILWKALYPLLRCVTDVRQTWLHLSLWRMLGSSTWTNASVPVEAAAEDKHGPICGYTVLHCTCIDKR